MKNSKLLDIILIQKEMKNSIEDNIDSLLQSVQKITIKNTTIVTLHELSYLKYIGITKEEKNKKFAVNLKSRIIEKFCIAAKNKKIYLVLPFYEVSRKIFYNTTIIISPNGKIISKYRKRNIPNEICYEEKYYFSSSNNSHPIVKVNGINVGLMICWDQWYSKSYNELSKKNADLIICPTAIGTAFDKNIKISLPNEKNKWINTIVANSLMINTPIVVVNRIGKEIKNNKKIDFWGSSFITNANGDIIYKADNKEGSHKITLDINAEQKYQKMWGFR